MSGCEMSPPRDRPLQQTPRANRPEPHGMGTRLTTWGRAHAHDFGWNVVVSVFHVPLRSSLSQSDAFAVYISPYPR